ncbi:hypothetical protein EGR_10191 [Echinococcus granulosus]|uniref:Uncharacterized protein n=1 Tax=Echinococcus granulosus TaxID=6210 RepID=W6U332_ECHGR|nr:hypothetical protein EGR_10191 [Echinococcus granulosus]EUB54956.1 hypothetical protein EGR_10191 [Echinococcus granulosus]
MNIQSITWLSSFVERQPRRSPWSSSRRNLARNICPDAAINDVET